MVCSEDDTPNHTIMVRGLAQHLTERDIRDNIGELGIAAKDIRLIRRKESGNAGLRQRELIWHAKTGLHSLDRSFK